MDEFLAPTGIDWTMGNEVGMVRYGTDNQIVLFYNKSVPNPAKSKETGRPYNEDVVYVRMHPPGERLNIIDRPVNPSDARRFPMQWAQFQQNKQQTASGTQIELLYPEKPSIAANLRAYGVQTIEQCAELSGTAIDQIGIGGQQWCNDAKSYLKSAEKGVHHNQLRNELDERDREIRSLKHKIDILTAQVEKVASNTQQPSPEQLMQVIQSMMARPQFPPPGIAPTQAFDAQAAQINATHASADIVETAKKTRRRVKI